MERFSFTVKYKSVQSPWYWVKDQSGQKDGEVVFMAQHRHQAQLSSYLDFTGSNVEATKFERNNDADHSWLLRAHVSPSPAQNGAGPQIASHNIGHPRRCLKWFALVRHSAPWIAPRQGRTKFHVENDTLLLSFLLDDGYHLVLLAVSLLHVSTHFRSDHQGNIWFVTQNDSSTPSEALAVAAIGRSFESANAAVFEAAHTILRNTDISRVSEIKELYEQSVATDDSQSLDDWKDGLTYCTWNALGQDLTMAKILDALRSLLEAGVRVASIIIDDNWQALDNPGQDQFRRQWTDFEADVQHFPGGLKGLCAEIRGKNPNIRHIAVWHGLLGYWGGMSPNNSIGKAYRMRTSPKAKVLTDVDHISLVDSEDAHQLFDDFYHFLTLSGVDAVKTDNQFLIDCLTLASDREALIPAYRHAWLSAACKHFGSKNTVPQYSPRVISCMSLVPCLLFQSALFSSEEPNDRDRMYTLRNSDDFFPDADDSHTFHIFWNAHNAHFTKYLRVTPDWDMFQTVGDYGAFHAAARCLSGGPIQITDEPGKHDMTVIRKMTAIASNGTFIALRPSSVGRSMNVYSAHNEGKFCRVGAYHNFRMSDQQSGVSILGLFNMASRTHGEFVDMSAFLEKDQVPADRRYVVRSYNHGTIMPIRNREWTLWLELGNREFEILSAYPTCCLPLGSDNPTLVYVVLGLMDQMTGAAAITSVSHGDHGLSITLKARGVLGLWFSRADSPEAHMTAPCRVSSIRLNGQFAEHDTWKWDGGVLLFDIERAWETLDFLTSVTSSSPEMITVEVLVEA